MYVRREKKGGEGEEEEDRRKENREGSCGRTDRKSEKEDSTQENRNLSFALSLFWLFFFH